MLGYKGQSLARVLDQLKRLVALGPLLLAACATVPDAVEFRSGEAVLPAPSPGVLRDGRGRFRGIFCEVARQRDPSRVADAPGCDNLLWRLSDEPPMVDSPALPPLDRELQIFVVGGAFSDCFGDASLAYRRILDELSAEGFTAREIPISSRSGATRNAAMINEALAKLPASSGRPLVLVGYSKGTVDILQFLVDYPQTSERVTAVVSVAGPVFGSQVAAQGAWAYDIFLSQAFSGRCDTGDGGVVDSLLPDVRRQWLVDHPLPRHPRYYSLLAFTTREHLARGLELSWRILADIDPRNDGQVAIEEGVIPGSTLLGYANSDHWGVAIDIERELEFFAAREDPTPYPRSALFEALLRYVSEDLAATPGRASR